MGWYMVGADLLRLAGVSMNLLRPQDFASYLIVLKLFSTDTMEKLHALPDPIGSTSGGDKGVLSLTRLFVRIHLYAVNKKSVPQHPR